MLSPSAIGILNDGDWRRTRARRICSSRDNALDTDADGSRSTGLRAPSRACASVLGQLRGAVGNFRDPTKPRQATAAHACPGAIEGCAASPRGPGHVHSRRHANYHYLPYTAAQSNEAAFSARRRPFPDEKGLPAQPRLHYLATYSAGAAKPALPSSSRAVALQGRQPARSARPIKPWAST